TGPESLRLLAGRREQLPDVTRPQGPDVERQLLRRRFRKRHLPEGAEPVLGARIEVMLERNRRREKLEVPRGGGPDHETEGSGQPDGPGADVPRQGTSSGEWGHQLRRMLAEKPVRNEARIVSAARILRIDHPPRIELVSRRRTVPLVMVQVVLE